MIMHHSIKGNRRKIVVIRKQRSHQQRIRRKSLRGAKERVLLHHLRVAHQRQIAQVMKRAKGSLKIKNKSKRLIYWNLTANHLDHLKSLQEEIQYLISLVVDHQPLINQFNHSSLT